MIKTTRKQREALKRVFDRGPLYGSDNRTPQCKHEPAKSYRAFRRTVQGTFFMDGCVMVPWCGMWLGIETDGYTHS